MSPALRFKEFDSSWKTARFGDELLGCKLGGNYPNSETVTAHPLIKMGNLGRGDMNLRKVEYIEDGQAINPDDEMKDGDLFFNTRNTLELVGKVAIWRSELPKAYYNSNLMRLQFACNHFMNYRFNTAGGIEALRRLATGTTSVAAIYTRDLLQMEFNLPALPEQQKIADFLTVVDRRLAQLSQKKTLLETYKKGATQQIFTQALRFQDSNGNDFPDWEEKFAKDVFARHSNKSHNSDLPILSASQEKGMVRRDENNIQIQATDKSVASYKVVDVGDFVISLRSFQGGIEYSAIKGICSPAYTILRAKLPVEGHFYRHYFKTESFIDMLSNTVVGIRDGKQISYDAFGTLEIPLPSNTEQTKIANFLTALDRKLEEVAAQIAHAQTWKKGLLQQMFV